MTSFASSLAVQPADLAAVEAMREDYRREMACQIVHDSWHRRGFSSLFTLHVDGARVGYAAVGGPPGEPRNVLKEFYLAPEHRPRAQAFARRVIEMSGARFMEAQTNDVQLSLLLKECTVEHSSEILLFADNRDRGLAAPGVTLRALGAAERETVFVHHLEPVGPWGLETERTIVATGGLLTHYNPPFVDLYVEVAEPFRGRGYASYLVQELRRLAREAGHTPAARCNEKNAASSAALQRGGMRLSGRVVRGRIPSSGIP